MSRQSDLVRLLDISGAVVAGALTNAPNPITAGTIAYLGMSSAPTGWLKANGAAVSRTTYADLFSAIGTTFGSGDGSTTFNLPDLRGEFPRGLDDGRGVDSGRSLGSAQPHATQSHRHSQGTDGNSASGYNANGYTDASGNTLSGGGNQSGAGGFTFATTSDMLPVTSGGTTPLGGAETRPRNVALLACIKY